MNESNTPLLIGILQTDSVRPEFRDRHGDYPDMFRALLSRAAREAAAGPVAFEEYDVQHGEYPSDPGECDGYVITGSRDSVYDDLPWIARLSDYVRLLHQRRHKLIGVCFGHQLVAQALGGETLAAAGGWAVGVHDSEVMVARPWMQPSSGRFALLSSHQDQVTKLPQEADLLARNSFCPVAAFGIGDHILAIQGHPEFEKPYAEALLRFRRERLGEAVFEAGLASLERPTQQSLIGQWMLAFLRFGAAPLPDSGDEGEPTGEG